MLEKQIKSFKEGKKICDDMVHDYIHKDNPRYSLGTHRTRVAAMDETNTWEGFGYIIGTAWNFIKHPITVYRLILKKSS